jgi:integrase
MTVLFDAAGRRRSPATLPGYHAGRPPRNKGTRYPADPPTVEEIVAVMRHADADRHGRRLRAMIVVLWRAGLRIQEALALAEHDLDERRGSILVRTGKGGRPRDRARPRRRGAEHHPTPARPRQPRHRVHLPTGDRPRGDHRRRPHTPRTNDAG